MARLRLKKCEYDFDDAEPYFAADGPVSRKREGNLWPMKTTRIEDWRSPSPSGIRKHCQLLQLGSIIVVLNPSCTRGIRLVGVDPKVLFYVFDLSLLGSNSICGFTDKSLSPK